jgi:hypothetical protein
MLMLIRAVANKLLLQFLSRWREHYRWRSLMSLLAEALAPSPIRPRIRNVMML